MHCNLRPPEPRHSFAALITMPCQVWSHWTYPLAYYSVFAADTLLYVVTLTFDLRHWNLQRIACDVMKLCTKFERNWAICGGVIVTSVFDLMTFNILLHVALGSGIIFTKFDLRQLIRARIIAFFMLIRYVALWPWPLTGELESSWDIKHHVIKICTKFERNWAIPGWIIDNFANFCTRYLTLWPWPLTSRPWTFTALWMSCV